MTRWLEFEWNLEGDEMQVSSISDEKGDGKKLMKKWPMKDNKLNWLMFTTWWDESAIVTTHIINGETTDQQLQDYFS